MTDRPEIPTGVVPPLLTPRSADGAIDIDSLHRLVDHLIQGRGNTGSSEASGVHGIFALGSSGEVPYLTSDQRDLILRETVAAVDSRVPVVVGASEQTTDRVIDEARRLLAVGGGTSAGTAGIAGIVVTVPFYALSDEREIAAHFRAVAAAVPVPVIAYDIPVRTHQKLPSGLAAQLAAEGVLAGVKDSSGDDVSFRQLLLDTSGVPAFAAFTGHEVVVDGALLGGAAGVVPGLGNVDPTGYRRLFDAAKAGRWADVAAEQDRLAKLFRITGAADPTRVSPGAAGLGGFKTALVRLGVISSNVMSRPMEHLDSGEAAAVDEILAECGLL